MNMGKILWVFFTVWVFSFAGGVWAEDELPFPLAPIKAALADRTISQGPESSMLTRSPWGPEMYRQTVDAVVLIYLPGEVAGEDTFGSGVIVIQSGVILTNWHVVHNFPRAVIIFRPKAPKTLKNLTAADLWVAKVVVTYPEKDLAFLKLEQSLTGSKLFPPFSYVPLENPDNLMVGQDVFAIGHPEKLYWTYTEGVISQIRPEDPWEMGGRKFRATVLQTQTDISFGSSGGPLINSAGKLVGIISNKQGQAGLNFAISGHEIYDLLSHFQQKGLEQQAIKESSRDMSGPEALQPQKSSIDEQAPSIEKQYLTMVQTTIDEKWIAPPLTVEAPVVLKFRIIKSGEIFNIRVDQSSGNQHYDSSALRAVNSANPFHPFLSDLLKEYLDVSYRFIRE